MSDIGSGGVVATPEVLDGEVVGDQIQELKYDSDLNRTVLELIQSVDPATFDRYRILAEEQIARDRAKRMNDAARLFLKHRIGSDIDLSDQYSDGSVRVAQLIRLLDAEVAKTRRELAQTQIELDQANASKNVYKRIADNVVASRCCSSNGCRHGGTIREWIRDANERGDFKRDTDITHREPMKRGRVVIGASLDLVDISSFLSKAVNLAP